MKLKALTCVIALSITFTVCSPNTETSPAITEVWIAMPDDIRLAADIYFPAEFKRDKTNKHPT
jgi:predicted acyl esterase